MTHPPVVIAEETPVAAALRLMSRRVPPFRRLPVVDRNGRLIGVLSIDDALREIASELAAIDLVLRGESPYVLDGLVVEGESRSGTARER
jgi:Mg/Co/Ni transporter MgtE